MPELGDPTNDFAEDYFAARNRFLALTRHDGWTVESHPIAAKGPAGELLLIDVASRAGTGSAAGRTVIVSSGLHGVEGFLGSAVQCATLARLQTSLDLSPHPLKGRGLGRGVSLSDAEDPLSLTLSPETGARGQTNDDAANSPDGSPRLVFIHALNPYGFAWIRRCNEDNVDLNRNFPAAGNQYRGSPNDYGKLNWLLNKPSPPSPWEPFKFLSLVAILRYGIPRLKRAIATGQYDYPQGLFYGGSGPCETTRFVQSQLANWLGPGSGEVLHLDFHTGLGNAGDFQLLADVPPSPEQAARIRTVFGRDVVSGTASTTVAYSARGSIGEWCQTAAGERDYNYLCVEFGTHPPTKVLEALRAENRAQQWDRPETETYRWAKNLLKEAFCPRSQPWRDTAVEQGADLIRRAVVS